MNAILVGICYCEWSLIRIQCVSCYCRIFKSSSASGVLMKHATWTLSNLYRRKNPPLKSEYAARCLPILSQLLYHDNLNVISDTCWSLSFLADGSNKRIQQVIDAGVVMRLVELLM
ncbi:importin subunit alpha-7-like isoform X2 [Dysidea avara]|uniref:importin subunit alpha-7-like isoform X2 n=1 Tax=Dysidea avara TaxID=196820 RepID=UPI003322592B